MSRIGIIGAGAFGSALSIHASRLGHEIRLWVFEPELAAIIAKTRQNEFYLPGVTLPDQIHPTHDLQEACEGVDLLVFACPSKFLRTVSAQAAPFVPADAVVTVLSKGIENETRNLMTEVLEQTLVGVAPANISILSGPSFAIEVAEGQPTDVVVASPAFLAARKIQPILHSPLFRVYTSDDPVGVQLGGALKNIIAIAAGVCDQLGFGHNARAALITRGLTEMTRLGLAKGANPITFLGLAGIGDLILTCTSDLSRNRTLGRKIAQGGDPTKILSETRSVAEGFYAARSAHNLAHELDVDMPITEQVHAVLYDGKTIPDAARDLMSREFKNEFKGIIHA